MIKLYEGCWGVTRGGEKPAEAPKFPEVGSSFDFRRQDGTWIKVSVVQDAPAHNPVTWPDGVTEMALEDGTAVWINDGLVGIRMPGQENYEVEAPGLLAALLLAAADKVEGRG